MITTKVKWKAIFVSLFFYVYTFSFYTSLFLLQYILHIPTPQTRMIQTAGRSLQKKATPCQNTPLWWSVTVPPVGRAGCWRCGDGKLHLCYESKFNELKHHNLVEMIKTNPPLANPFYIYKEFSENNPELLVQNKNIKY